MTNCQRFPHLACPQLEIQISCANEASAACMALISRMLQVKARRKLRLKEQNKPFRFGARWKGHCVVQMVLSLLLSRKVPGSASGFQRTFSGSLGPWDLILAVYAHYVAKLSQLPSDSASPPLSRCDTLW